MNKTADWLEEVIMPSESRRLAMRRAHTKHKSYCTCGKVVSGNGGRHAHRAMHERKSDGHYYMTYSEWERRRLAGGQS